MVSPLLRRKTAKHQSKWRGLAAGAEENRGRCNLERGKKGTKNKGDEGRKVVGKKNTTRWRRQI
jgi:hypothetical protein